ncbi:MAG: glutamate--tRNA ligase [Sedimentisphaerales bacterium]|nr:glutamate--tRNA ligase [Sedimentisphaerales bacterium]
MIITRFPPSPTGYLHIGSARTALFCWLHARSNNGRLILRIEDTDLKRNTPTAVQQVIKDLQWLGIDWDEGPDKPGPNAPYLQSQRLDIYQKYVQQLLDQHKAYYCFDTTEELQVLRDAAQAAKTNFTYPRPEKFPTEADAQAARDQGRPVVVRLAMPNQDITVTDIIRGQVTFAAAELSDFIIQKSDGFPTYHLAVVVDDELMGVTDVIRGQEHLMNTPSHIALQQALGFRTPNYVHMSVTVSEGGGKLSKRERAKTLRQAIKDHPEADLDALAQAGSITRADLDSFILGESTPDQPNISAMAEFLHTPLPEINVVDFLHSGYIPEALLNFVALLGWNPGDNREIMPLDELIQSFDIRRLSKTNSLFDRKKLLAFNTEHMKMIAPEKLLAHFQNYLQIIESPLRNLDSATLAHIVQCCQGARTLAEIASKCDFLIQDSVTFDPKAVQKVLQKPNAPELLQITRDALDALTAWDEPSINSCIETLCTQHNVGMGKIAQPIRVAITGNTISPPIHDSLILLTKPKTIQRLDQTLQYLKTL